MGWDRHSSMSMGGGRYVVVTALGRDVAKVNTIHLRERKNSSPFSFLQVGFQVTMSLFRSALLLRQVPSRLIVGSASSLQHQRRGLQTGSASMGKVEKVAVIGSGLMGSGIAQVRPACLVGK